MTAPKTVTLTIEELAVVAWMGSVETGRTFAQRIGGFGGLTDYTRESFLALARSIAAEVAARAKPKRVVVGYVVREPGYCGAARYRNRSDSAWGPRSNAAVLKDRAMAEVWAHASGGRVVRVVRRGR